MNEPKLIITSGEPAGIGPELIAKLNPSDFNARLVVIGDVNLLNQRAAMLGVDLELTEYNQAKKPSKGLEVIHLPLANNSQPGKLDSNNADYVLQTLRDACQACLQGEFDAMVTAPVHKEIINRGGISFSGHTEFLAELCNVDQPVMLLIADALRVALVTTHLPLRQVADAITGESIRKIATIMEHDLCQRFGLEKPRIKVCGLNPHAGENGVLGTEEIEIITPAIDSLKADGLSISGPYPADSLFTPAMLADTDAVLAMYHDQGLPVLKHAGFHNAVNTTLGLPIIRTSVDHGTALEIAGSGQALPDSLFAAIRSAISQTHNRHANASAT